MPKSLSTCCHALYIAPFAWLLCEGKLMKDKMMEIYPDDIEVTDRSERKTVKKMEPGL